MNEQTQSKQIASLLLGAASIVVPELFKIAAQVLPALFNDTSETSLTNTMPPRWGHVVINGIRFLYNPELNKFFAMNASEAEDDTRSRGLYLSNNPAVDGVNTQTAYYSLPPFTEQYHYPSLDLTEDYSIYKNGSVIISTEPPIEDVDSSIPSATLAEGIEITAGMLYSTLAAVTLGAVIFMGGGIQLYTYQPDPNVPVWSMGIRATNSVPQRASANVNVTAPSGVQANFSGAFDKGASSSLVDSDSDSPTTLIEWELPSEITYDPALKLAQVSVSIELDGASATEIRKASRGKLSYGAHVKWGATS